MYQSYTAFYLYDRILDMAEQLRGNLAVGVSVAALIENGQRQLLMVRQAKDQLWGPPGGKLESGENVISAARREVEQTVGAEFIATGMLGIYSQAQGKGTGMEFVFVGKIIGEPRIVRPRLIADMKFFEYRDILTMIANGKISQPEYNNRVLSEWRTHPVYPAGMIKPFLNR